MKQLSAILPMSINEFGPRAHQRGFGSTNRQCAASYSLPSERTDNNGAGKVTILVSNFKALTPEGAKWLERSRRAGF